MNIVLNGKKKTVNIINIIEQLNGITDILQGTSGGTISDTQIQKLNQDIATVINEINLLKQDVEKYIDEDELKLKTDILEQGISNSVSKSDFDTKTLQILSQINNLSMVLANLSNTQSTIDLSNYPTKQELDTTVVDKITERLTTVEPKWKQEVTSSITSNLETVIDTKNQETLDLVNQSITLNMQGLNDTIRDINSSLSNYVLKSKYDRDMRDVVRNWGEPSFNSLSVSGETRLSGTSEIVTLNVENLSIRNASHTSKFVSMPNLNSLELGSNLQSLNLLGTGTLKYNNEEVALQKNIPVLTETEKLIKNDTNNNFTGENNFTNLKVNNNPVMNFKTVFEGKELIVYKNLGESLGESGATVSQSYAMFVGAKEYNFVAITLESLNMGSAEFNYEIMRYYSKPLYSKTFIIPKGKSHIEIIKNNGIDFYIKINDNSQEITLAFMNYDNSNPFCLTKVSIF